MQLSSWYNYGEQLIIVRCVMYFMWRHCMILMYYIFFSTTGQNYNENTFREIIRIQNFVVVGISKFYLSAFILVLHFSFVWSGSHSVQSAPVSYLTTSSWRPIHASSIQLVIYYIPSEQYIGQTIIKFSMFYCLWCFWSNLLDIVYCTHVS